MTTMRDAVHGDVHFDSLETAFINTAVVQRLRGIKQLGAANLVFPSAVHTRFEHSLGTCWLTKRIITALCENGHSISADEQRAARLTALLHDVTHVPFGHTFEDERRLFERHDDDALRLNYFLEQPELAELLNASGVGDIVRNTLSPNVAGKNFVRDLAAGTVCADLLDYLRRDAYFSGLNLNYDDRLFRYFQLSDGRLVFSLHKEGMFRRDALSELIHLLQMRYTLTERVYYHHAKIVAGAMISRALESALDAGVFQREELYELRDDGFLERLRLRSTDVPGLPALLDDVTARRLYKRVYLVSLAAFGKTGIDAATRDQLAARYHHQPQQRRELEQAAAAELGVPAEHVIVYCPSPKMALKEADVLVQVERGKNQPLSSLDHPDVNALAEKHQGLWRFYVCLRREHEAKFAKAGDVCERLLGHPNQLELQRAGRFHFH